MGEYFIFVYLAFQDLFTPCIRTYQKEQITGNEISNVSKDLVVTHIAIFERFVYTYKKDNVASCVTLMSHEGVPAGINHNVIF